MSQPLYLRDNSLMFGLASVRRLRPRMLHAAVLSLLLCAILHAAAFGLSLSRPTLVTPRITLSTAINKRTVSHPTPATSQPSGGANTPVATPIVKPVAAPATTPNCTPDTYNGLVALDLAASQAGLSQVIDATHYYQVYGASGAQARQQIIQCAPRLSNDGDDYTGYTAYRLSWLYNYSSNGSGQCTLSNVKIGMHIGMVLPSLQIGQAAASGFGANWQAFATALNTHEQGHVSLDEQYASKLTSDLQNFPASDCATISQAATNLINSEVAALDQANATYDSQTNHGATQGAVLPQ